MRGGKRNDGSMNGLNGPRPETGGELKAVMDRERQGGEFVSLRDSEGVLRIIDLDATGERVSIGRDASNSIAITWDREVSRLHATMTPAGGEWIVEDDGFSRNGTFLNGERLAGSARLRERDWLRVGGVAICFHSPKSGSSSETLTTADGEPPRISEAEGRVLRSLAGPWIRGDKVPVPPSNGEIAAELVLSVHTVKSHLRVLFEKFGLGDVPQSRKRISLVEAAYRAGVITHR